ncbi:PBSX family phage terminase large subunit [Escherichia coli]|uniref:PBSX family phage terminase large subunit n=1 Tax=Escherichia coli TaxID=562 RepID=UPI00403E3F6C
MNKIYSLNPALREFWQTESRYKALYGGRASSKSHDAAGFAVYLAANYKLKFMCARQFQNRISESVYTLIKDKIEASEFNGEFTFTNNSIKHKTTGSEFLFYGIARNLAEIKSTEGVDILWLEEANYLTKEQWEVIEPTIRKEHSQIWLIWNPDELMDFIYQNFVVNPPADCVHKQINWE